MNRDNPPPNPPGIQPGHGPRYALILHYATGYPTRCNERQRSAAIVAERGEPCAFTPHGDALFRDGTRHKLDIRNPYRDGRRVVRVTCEPLPISSCNCELHRRERGLLPLSRYGY
jgi:hypothetical protein